MKRYDTELERALFSDELMAETPGGAVNTSQRRNVLRDPAAQAAWPEDSARETVGKSEKNTRDVLNAWDRENFFGGKSVQLRVPLRDPVEAMRHLEIIESAVHELRFKLQNQQQSDRSNLLMVHAVIKALNLKLNAYRNPSR